MKASEHKKEKMREYQRNHRKQYSEYQRKYIEKLRSEGKKPKSQCTIYKERIDKAIKFIDEWCFIDDNGKCICNLKKHKCTDLLNILQGANNG